MNPGLTNYWRTLNSLDQWPGIIIIIIIIMHNIAPVLENDTHKLLWDFDIHTDHLISARKPDLIIINNKKKENLQNCQFCCLG